MILGLSWVFNVKSQPASVKPFSNPAFMYGTDLGTFLQVYYKLGKFDQMLNFTASESIKKYGKEKILNYYENCKFGYEIKLMAMSGDGKYKILSYNAKIMATNNVIRIKAIVENDTAKIVLDNLKITMGN